MTYLTASILTLAVLLIGGSFSIAFISSITDSTKNERLQKSLVVTTEVVFLASPSAIFMILGFLSATASFWIVLTTIILFVVVLLFLDESDFECFILGAIFAILLPHISIAYSDANLLKQQLDNAEVIDDSTSGATNYRMHWNAVAAVSH